jgi:hypothetical protein
VPEKADHSLPLPGISVRGEEPDPGLDFGRGLIGERAAAGVRRIKANEQWNQSCYCCTKRNPTHAAEAISPPLVT